MGMAQSSYDDAAVLSMGLAGPRVRQYFECGAAGLRFCRRADRGALATTEDVEFAHEIRNGKNRRRASAAAARRVGDRFFEPRLESNAS
jgi:hypothetical protein